MSMGLLKSFFHNVWPDKKEDGKSDIIHSCAKSESNVTTSVV